MDHPTAWLEFPSQEKIFLTESCSIGRSPENRIVIGLDGVSRRHAVLRKGEDGVWMLMDMGSSNGTYLNGERLSRPAPLRDGNIIEIGKQRMTFRTPPVPLRATETIAAPPVECWLMVVSATLLGCRTPSSDFGDKTYESWSERGQRVVTKYRGKVMRALDDGFLAYWPMDAGGSANTVATVLSSLRSLQKSSEQFRFALHAGAVDMRESATGGQVPTGSELIYTMQLDRLGRALDQPVLITEAAASRLGPALMTRPLNSTESRDYRGSTKLFVPV